VTATGGRFRRVGRSGLAALVGAAAGAALAWGFAVYRGGGPGAHPAPARMVGPFASGGQPAARTFAAEPELHSPFALLAQDARAGVVNVHTSKTVPRPALPFPDVPVPGFPNFFGGPGSETVPSLGSGFVISADGLVLTNNHVVDGVDRVRVVFSDGAESDAEVVGQDPKTDLALLRVERTDLHPLPLGDSDTILPGDWVVAIGSPFGLDHTVTVGIVSGKGRDIGHGPYDDYIQTDAAMNPGNSGGPLLDMRGQVVGINAAINPEANTIGFAVPINLAKEIVPQLRDHGRVTRGWLGVAVQPLTPEIARALGLESTQGALVSQVRPGSPAQAADVRRGDVIVAYRGEKIGELRSLPGAVSATRVGEEVELELIRDGERRTVVARVGELAEEPLASAPPPEAGGVEHYGLEVQELPRELRERLGLDEGGVVVSGVEPGGLADRAGLRRGDLILEADRRPVAGIPDLARAFESAGEDGTLLLVQRGDTTVFVMLERSRG
jgi:serine protease Do